MALVVPTKTALQLQAEADASTAKRRKTDNTSTFERSATQKLRDNYPTLKEASGYLTFVPRRAHGRHARALMASALSAQAATVRCGKPVGVLRREVRNSHSEQQAYMLCASLPGRVEHSARGGPPLHQPGAAHFA